MIHIKRFHDAYSQSREHFFLDLLKQQGAPVPQIIKNDIPNKEIHMTHVGVNLREWLSGLDRGLQMQTRAMHVLHECLVCSQKISELGVWHLDLASRNFMVSDDPDLMYPSVHVIDFSLATSTQFPLQKPLWIRPHGGQHHLVLQEAVIKDWIAFFEHARLQPPSRYDTEFDIPLSTYAKTWLTHLAVDQLSHPWCVIAHSLGALFIEASAAKCFDDSVGHQLNQLGSKAQNIQVEREAISHMANMTSYVAAFSSNETPRPRARSNAHEQQKADLSSRPTTGAKMSPLLFIMVVISAGYWLADVLFAVYKIEISTLSAVSVATVSLTTLLALGFSLFGRCSRLRLTRSLQLHSISMFALGIDLWINDLSMNWFYVFLLISVAIALIGEKNIRTAKSDVS